ncbi:hypothetical protein T08_11740 [Trichinella sp. T8]|uniref:Uncharacterized protein n=1 Tax=Trichinella murrelli TaxID=144512 RepID=A0A0V0TT83_9BILA|nr:hypothetical protein T05_1026 [Trichinella murrelli]KRZ85445.1 hypothetical protein T08_11740 [Trichinella sp. T8]
MNITLSAFPFVTKFHQRFLHFACMCTGQTVTATNVSLSNEETRAKEWIYKMERHRLLRLIQHCFIVISLGRIQLICIICDIFVEKVSVRLSNGINFETTPGDKLSNRNVEKFCPDIFLHAQPGS